MTSSIPSRTPNAPSATIFRDEALRYRLEHRRKRGTALSLPPAMSRQVGTGLWVLLGLLLLAGVGVCRTPVAVPVAAPREGISRQVETEHVRAGTFLPLVGRIFEE
jgi:hypothetical protein